MCFGSFSERIFLLPVDVTLKIPLDRFSKSFIFLFWCSAMIKTKRESMTLLKSVRFCCGMAPNSKERYGLGSSTGTLASQMSLTFLLV